MKTVTISVSSPEATKQRLFKAFKGKPQGAHLSFPSVEALWKVLAPNRLALVRALAGAGVISIREAARRVNRDVRAVHSDVKILLNAGVLHQAEDGIEFPFEALHVDFTLKAA
jgi:predicted transcriptional regulator